MARADPQCYRLESTQRAHHRWSRSTALIQSNLCSNVLSWRRVKHRFNRLYGENRRDVFLLRTETAWQVLGRQGGADGQEVTHNFDQEDEARAMLRRMLLAVPPELSNRAHMTQLKTPNTISGWSS